MNPPFFAIYLAAFIAPLGALGETALKALKALPKGESQRLARIEGRGTFVDPEQWHFYVQDKETPPRLREYVVAEGEILAVQDAVETSEPVKDSIAMGKSTLKVDSDDLAQIAQAYAAANNSPVTSFRYELQREGATAAPTWIVTCFDESGAELGAIVVSAKQPKVLARDGFPLDPPEKSKKSSGKAAKFQPQSAIEIDEGEPLESTVGITGESAVDTTQAQATAATGDEAAQAESDLPTEPDTVSDRPAKSSSRKKASNGGRSASPSQESDGPRVVRPIRRVTTPVRRILRRVMPF